MGLSGLHWQLARVAAIWLLSASLVHSRGHPTRLSRHTDSAGPTVATGASASEDEQQEDQVVVSSRHKHESQHFQIDIAHRRQPPEAPIGAPSDAETVPSSRCANREEWQGVCRLWSGKSHNRYLVFHNLQSKEGIGANLMRVAWGLNRAISFDLEPIFIGPLRASHGAGDFGNWIGLTHNPLLAIQDPEALERASNQNVPFPESDGDAWFREQENRTSVVYQANAMKVHKIKDWGIPVSTPNADAGVCLYVRQALRNVFWSVPQKRGRCHAFLREEHGVPPQAVVSTATRYQPGRKRPWVLAVHVRRGDMIKFHGGARSVPHKYFSVAVRSVLRAIAVTDPAAHVSVLVFSEGPETLKGLQLPDEHGKAITWDIENESCVDIGLICAQAVFLRASAFETFDCLAAADVVVGSESSFSEAAAAVSTNVKVMLWENQTEQDRVTLNSQAAVLSGAVSVEEQLKINTAVADWWHCSEEAQRSTGFDAESLAARRFYQTVD